MVFGLFKKRTVVLTRKKTIATSKNKRTKKGLGQVKKSLKKKTTAKRKTIKQIPAVPTLEVVGKVTHYFPHVKAGVVKLTMPLTIGEKIHILGHTTNFKQTVTSMQINNVPIKEARPGDEIGLLVKSRVRHNDVVYRL